MGSPILSFAIESLIVLPDSFNFGLESTEVYVLNKDTILPTDIDFECDCLTPINILGGWMNFTSADQMFTVFTYERKNIGIHEIVLVTSLENFPNFKPYSKFTLTVNPSPDTMSSAIIIRKPPYFEPALSNQ